jgi:hypothetical protein
MDEIYTCFCSLVNINNYTNQQEKIYPIESYFIFVGIIGQVECSDDDGIKRTREILY